MTVSQMARLLGIEPAIIRAHVEAGAPTGPRGRLNLVHYTAWLLCELEGRQRR